MMDKTASAIAEELKKIRGDQDKIQAYLKTTAETLVAMAADIATIATNTTPADAPEEPAAGSGEE